MPAQVQITKSTAPCSSIRDKLSIEGRPVPIALEKSPKTAQNMAKRAQIVLQIWTWCTKVAHSCVFFISSLAVVYTYS